MSLFRRTTLAGMILFSCSVSQYRQAEVPLRVGVAGLQEEENAGRKSPILGIVLSLVIPGTGEWYAGNFSTGKYFLGADAALWITYAGVSSRGSWVRGDARSYAATHAGVSLNGKDEQFEVDLGNFLTTADYNQAKLRNREFDLLYETPGAQWAWDSDENRTVYRTLRIHSDELFQNSRFVLGALVVNRIISAFSAWRSVNRHNSSFGANQGWRVQAELQGGVLQMHGLTIKITKVF